MAFEVIVAETFADQYKLLPAPIRRKSEKQLALFRNNPFHPSLHTEKLAPKQAERWSFRVDRRYRILFRFVDARGILLIAIGTHDWLYRQV